MCSKVQGFCGSFLGQLRGCASGCCGRIGEFLRQRNFTCEGARKALSDDMAKLKDDVRTMKFWRAIIAEFMGVFFLVLIGCGAWTQTVEVEPGEGLPRPTVRISLAMGFTYGAILWCVKCVSEGHLNPSVSIAFLVTRRISLLRCGLYVLSQMFGGIMGGVILLGLVPYDHRREMGCTTLAPGVSHAQGFGVEFFATFMLVFVVMASYEKTRTDEVACIPFVLGITLAASSLFSVPITGGSMNTARSFGPSLAASVWDDHWIYWFGPILGGICGGALFDVIFSTKASFTRLRSCFLLFHKGETPAHEPKPVGPTDELTEHEAERQTLRSGETDDTEVMVDMHHTNFPRDMNRQHKLENIAEVPRNHDEKMTDASSMPDLEGDPPRAPPRSAKRSDQDDEVV